jgi:hypothetical protein
MQNPSGEDPGNRNQRLVPHMHTHQLQQRLRHSVRTAARRRKADPALAVVGWLLQLPTGLITGATFKRDALCGQHEVLSIEVDRLELGFHALLHTANARQSKQSGQRRRLFDVVGTPRFCAVPRITGHIRPFAFALNPPRSAVRTPARHSRGGDAIISLHARFAQLPLLSHRAVRPKVAGAVRS